MNLSDSGNTGTAFATPTGEIPGEGAQPVTNLVAAVVSAGQRSRPTDFISNPAGAGNEIAASSIQGLPRDFTTERGPSPAEMFGPDHDIRAEDLPIDGSGKGPIPDPPAGTRGCGSINETSVPFRNLRSEK
jgi:hypothetical protein